MLSDHLFNYSFALNYNNFFVNNFNVNWKIMILFDMNFSLKAAWLINCYEQEGLLKSV